MKKLIIGLMALGLTGLCFSQNSTSGIAEVQLKGVVVSATNNSYLIDVLDGNTSPRVRQLQLEAAKYNIKDTKGYDPNFESIQVVFKQSTGKKQSRDIIKATYDKNGKITNASEKFNNIILPPTVRSSIYKDHNGWDLKKNSYQVSYRPGKEVKKVYKVQLKNGKLKKNLKLDSNGRFLKLS